VTKWKSPVFWYRNQVLRHGDDRISGFGIVLVPFWDYGLVWKVVVTHVSEARHGAPTFVGVRWVPPARLEVKKNPFVPV
jgi:hypothetical protein